MASSPDTSTIDPVCDLPDPADIHIASIETLDRLRESYGFSKSEFSRRAGVDDDRWAEIVRESRHPRIDTYQAFVDVLKEADPDGPRSCRGRKSRGDLDSEGARCFSSRSRQ